MKQTLIKYKAIKYSRFSNLVHLHSIAPKSPNLIWRFGSVKACDHAISQHMIKNIYKVKQTKKLFR